MTNAPSLFSDGSLGTQTPRPLAGMNTPKTLLDLLYDGFYLVFLLRSGYQPTDFQLLRNNIQQLLDDFERGAKRMNVPMDDIYASKYAFCALVDETVLRSNLAIRAQWERQPLQLALFGDQLAGENFFVQLDKLRNQGAHWVQVLEVFHFCLLLGFQGKYLLDAPEKLSYLVARLGDEIAYLRGKRNGFAPFAAIPDQIKHVLRGEVPLSGVIAAIVMCAVVAYAGFNWLLNRQVNAAVAPYNNVVQMPAQAAHITITLP